MSAGSGGGTSEGSGDSRAGAADSGALMPPCTLVSKPTCLPDAGPYCDAHLQSVLALLGLCMGSASPTTSINRCGDLTEIATQFADTTQRTQSPVTSGSWPSFEKRR